MTVCLGERDEKNKNKDIKWKLNEKQKIIKKETENEHVKMNSKTEVAGEMKIAKLEEC